MVSRKHLPAGTSDTNANQGNVSQGVPPYPTTPTRENANSPNHDRPTHSPDVHGSPGFDLIDMKDGRSRTRSDSDASHGTWDTDSEEEEYATGTEKTKINEADIPKPLRISASKQNIKPAQEQSKSTNDALPAILRPGPVGGAAPVAGLPQPEDPSANPWASSGISTPKHQPVNATLDSNNPYRQQNANEPSSSQSAWQESNPIVPATAPPQRPPVVPVELPAVHTPADELQNIPWELDRPLTTASYDTVEVLPVPQQGRPPLPPVASKQDLDFPPTNPWSQEGNTAPQARQDGANAVSSPAIQNAPSTNGDLLIDHEPQAQPQIVSQPLTRNEFPRQSTETAPAFPQPNVEQRAEHYSIKCVNWYDANIPGIRRSPILTQNANGPCPLLALVNALTLSTPHNANTALVEVLQTRETISLGLLLDAVFDELVSGRREPGPYGLPDVDELYSFLLALHTGMNVNPRFITAAVTPRGSFDGHPAASAHIHPSDRAQNKPGCFEETREMRLYSTFQIPLIHGWVPIKGTPDYEAFDRSAQTFEDAQNIQFAESELEDKRRHEGLGPQEDQVLQDIRRIKTFLQTWPTQLTEYGLELISRSLQPGQVAILFRNDHFSTLYKEPKHGALMTLITDAGYSTHEEIVWESLVDVNGAAAEMFSGDFRVVSHNKTQHLNQNSSAGGDEGWQTVTGRTNQRQQQTVFNDDIPPPLPGPRPQESSANPSSGPGNASEASIREQEDHDLALALQLQEEEEDQERQAQERRIREQRLSEQMISNEAEGARPEIPPRRNQLSNTGRRNSNVPNVRPPAGRPPVNRPTDSPGDPEAPPSYQQAASDRPYRPAGATAAGAQGNPLNTYDALLAQQSGGQPQANVAHSGMQGGRRWSNNRPRPSSAGHAASSSSVAPNRITHAAGVKDAEEKCIVM